MSAQEFGEWKTLFSLEGLTLKAERLRHAQLLAAAHNGPLTKADKSMWRAVDLLPGDPWAPVEQADSSPPSAAELAAQVDRINRLLH